MKHSYGIHTGLARAKSHTKKYILGGLAAIVMATGASMPALALSSAAPKATGGIGYTAYGLQRFASFDVRQGAGNCMVGWNVNGTYTLDFEYQGGHYVHDATISGQNSNTYSVAGGYPAGGNPYSTAWSGTGSITGNTLTNSVDYTAGAPNTHMNMTGTIAPNGTISGTWTDNYGGATRNGTWTTASGVATQSPTGCAAKGTFTYVDFNGTWYIVDVKYAKVVGADSWFAGPVIYGSTGTGQWLFAKVHDGGTPGTNGDQISGSFTTEAAAKLGVATMANPGDGPFAAISGNLVVH